MDFDSRLLLAFSAYGRRDVADPELHGNCGIMNIGPLKRTVHILLSFLLLSFLNSAGIAHELTMDKITILDREFKILRVINDPGQLVKAEKQWEALIPIDKLPDTNWTHKLDIDSDTVGGRWLYNEEGYIAKLNYRLKPMYKVADTKLFNEVYLGL